MTAPEADRVPITAWDHNRWYHRLLLGQVPAGAERVLDVGCGAGTLACALAARVRHVDAVDRSPVMVARARERVPANVRVHLADALTVELPGGAYDAVLSSAVLHHLPLPEALRRMAHWLRPGGVLAAVALPRRDLPRELPVELAAAAASSGLGLAFAALRPLTGTPLFAPEPTHGEMPLADPVLTVRRVRAATGAVLPGARVRRLLLWRYLLTWRRPG